MSKVRYFLVATQFPCLVPASAGEDERSWEVDSCIFVDVSRGEGEEKANRLLCALVTDESSLLC